jgi:ATP-dependent helicase/nuclease subunit B
MFTDLGIEYPPAAVEKPDDIQNPHQLARWLGGTLGKDRGTVASDQSTVNSEDVAAGVLHRMADSEDDSLKQTAEHVKQSLAYDNAAGLDTATANALFSFPMMTSVTRLGTFAKCPYQYFARYTLGLERRQLLRFEPMDVGTFYHDVLEATFKALKKQGKDWADLSNEELLAVCDTECDTVLADNTQLVNFTRRRAHHKYIIDAAKQVIRSFVPMLAQLSRAGRFKQAAAELAVGPKETLRLIIPLDKKRKIEFKGFIDRLDVADIDGKQAALVFDYKTGGKSVDFAGMLYGLDVQLPVYLLAIGGHGLTPAGAFFLPIDGGTNSASLSDLESIARGFNKAKGLFDGRFFETLDLQAAASGGHSEYYNFYVNKDSEPYSYYNTSGALKSDDFQTLLNYTEQCIKKLIENLSSGCITITPYRIGTTSPCTWCDYRTLCRFDWQINDYNILESVKKEQALTKMKQ